MTTRQMEILFNVRWGLQLAGATGRHVGPTVHALETLRLRGYLRFPRGRSRRYCLTARGRAITGGQ